MSAAKIETGLSAGELPEWLEIVRHLVNSLRYGSVEIVVHNSTVTQIEKIERVRLNKPQPEIEKMKTAA